MRIATIVHGRIFGFDLARGLLANRGSTLLLTNYPRRVVAHYGVPPECVRTNVLHGVVTRILQRLVPEQPWVEPFLHRWFGRWTAKVIRREQVDTVQVFSGVAEEVFDELKRTRPEVLRILIRASTHIKTQYRILSLEEKKLGSPVEKPSAWRILREVKEYRSAHRVMLLSKFTYQSFTDRGYPDSHLIHLPMGADAGAFGANPKVVAARLSRIRAGEPLRVLIVGTFSARKGARTLLETARVLAPEGIQFRFVGGTTPDAAHLRAEAEGLIEFAGFQPQKELPEWYAQGDVFFFPTLEDGFPAVLAQALSGGLPLLTTPNSSAADLVTEGVNGWIKSPGDSTAFIEQLRWCHNNREELAKLVEGCGTDPYVRNWPLVSKELLEIAYRVRSECGLPDISKSRFTTQRKQGEPLRVAIAAHGRFHAFDLCRALKSRKDVEVLLLTNLPYSNVAPYGLPRDQVLIMPWHRILHRLIYLLWKQGPPTWLQRLSYPLFGRWAKRTLERLPERPHVIRIFSSVAEEVLLSQRLEGCVRILTRGSSHILTQKNLLLSETARTGANLLTPSDYLVAREIREYSLADATIVLSTFAERSFSEHGYPHRKLWVIPNAVNLNWYGATQETMAQRKLRILSGEPLRVLMVGTFSYRKGVKDIVKIVDKLKDRFRFRFVGDMPRETMKEQAELRSAMEFHERVSPDSLASFYTWGDVFLFPTLEDGFPATLAQALAGGLVTLTTTHCSGPDVITDGVNGWCLPIRDAEANIDKLEWLDANRPETYAMCEAAAKSATHRSWDQVAEDFVSRIEEAWPHLKPT